MKDVFDYSQHMIEIVSLHKQARQHLLQREWTEAEGLLFKMLNEVMTARNFCIQMEQKEANEKL